MRRLSAKSLAGLEPGISPAHDRDLETGTLHLGIGAFARAHVAVYADDRASLGDRTAGICGVSLRSTGTVAALRSQDGLYSLIETESGGSSHLRVIGSVMSAEHGPDAAIEQLASPETAEVTITVTEAGYLRSPRGGIDDRHPVVRADLAALERDPLTSTPTSLPGVLVAGLTRRRAAGSNAPIVMSCDNLPDNGGVVAEVTTSMADAIDSDLAAWIADEVSFTPTVVDRIVPAPSEVDRHLVGEQLGFADDAVVRAEPHRSWIIRDTPGLAPWERAGAQIVDDVRPWEERKLRTVNGPHSALAYLGGLAGSETIDAAAREPRLAAFVRSLLHEEVVPTLSHRSEGDDHLAAEVLDRFANPMLGHRCAQVAADGSQKLAQRVVEVAVERRRRSEPVDRLALVIAAWISWVAGSGKRLRDPLVDELTAIVGRCTTSLELVDSMLDLRSVFTAEAAEDPVLREAIVGGLDLISRRGALVAAEALT